jgi:hypothetical protein
MSKREDWFKMPEGTITPGTKELTEQLKTPSEEKKDTKKPRKAAKPKTKGKDAPKEEKDVPAASPEHGEAFETKDQERLHLIEGMKAYAQTMQFQAKKAVGISVSESVWPPTLEGCIFLSDKMQELHENKGNKP